MLTWQKAGSQWTRDLLTHHFVQQISRCPNANVSFEADPAIETSTLPGGAVYGPVYKAGLDHWNRWRDPRDRAVVVLRDPRDLIVSRTYSFALSHVPTPMIARVRRSLLSLSPAQRLLTMLARFQSSEPSFREWSRLGPGIHGPVYVTSYERLVADTCTELSRIFEFLNWCVPHNHIRQVVSDLSFETRSGRQPGDEEVFSHLRRGTPGDWRRHFDRTCAIAFELSCPRLLLESGYDLDPEWFEKVPGESATAGDAFSGLKEHVELQAEVVRLREQNRWLQRALEQQRIAG